MSYYFLVSVVGVWLVLSLCRISIPSAAGVRAVSVCCSGQRPLPAWAWQQCPFARLSDFSQSLLCCIPDLSVMSTVVGREGRSTEVRLPLNG